MEDLVLKGYYNIAFIILQTHIVVEDLVLKGYYNIIPTVLTTAGCGRPCFEGLLQLVGYKSSILTVVEDLVLKGYYNLS